MKTFVITYLIIGMVVLGALTGFGHSRGKPFPTNSGEIVVVITTWPAVIGMVAVALWVRK